MPIGVLERAGVAAPECIMRRIGDRRARFFDLRHDGIYFCFARDIVAERALSRASRAKRNFGLMGKRCAGPNGELQAMLKIKEGDGAIRGMLACKLAPSLEYIFLLERGGSLRRVENGV